MTRRDGRRQGNGLGNLAASATRLRAGIRVTRAGLVRHRPAVALASVARNQDGAVECAATISVGRSSDRSILPTSSTSGPGTRRGSM